MRLFGEHWDRLETTLSLFGDKSNWDDYKRTHEQQREMINKCIFITGIKRICSFVVWIFNQLRESMRLYFWFVWIGLEFNLVLMVSTRIRLCLFITTAISNCRTEYLLSQQNASRIFRGYKSYDCFYVFSE